MISRSDQSKIGLDFVLELVNTVTPFGTRRKQEKKYYNDGGELFEEQRAVSIFSEKLINRYNEVFDFEYELCRIRDIRGSINRAKSNSTLDEVELFEIKYFSNIISKMIEKYKKIDIKDLDFKFKSLDQICKKLDPRDTGILTFHVYSEYSKRLMLIRKEKKEIENKIFLEKDPSLKEQLFDKRQNIVVDEENESRKIREELSSFIGKYADDFFYNMDAIAKIDHWIAKAKLVKDKKAIIAFYDIKNTGINLFEAYNPLIESMLKEQGDNYQKIDIRIEKNVNVLTGANMGGKSVSLITVLLNSILFAMGYPIFAKKASMELFDFVYYMGEDKENFSKGLSSFGGEMISLRNATSLAKKSKGLIIFDEPARGTNPKEGVAIVKAMCEFFKKRDSVFLISTHFENIVDSHMEHFQIVGFEDVDFDALKASSSTDSMTLKKIKLGMDYRIKKVLTSSKIPQDAVNICELLGIDKEIIDYSKSLLKEVKFE